MPVVSLRCWLLSCIHTCGAVSTDVELYPQQWNCILSCGALSTAVELYPQLCSGILNCGAVSIAVELYPKLWSCIHNCGAVSSAVELYPQLWSCIHCKLQGSNINLIDPVSLEPVQSKCSFTWYTRLGFISPKTIDYFITVSFHNT